MTAGGKAWSGLGHMQLHVSITTLLRSPLGMPCAEANMLAPWVQLKDVAKQSWLPQMPCLWRGVALDEKHLGKDNPERMNNYCVFCFLFLSCLLLLFLALARQFARATSVSPRQDASISRMLPLPRGCYCLTSLLASCFGLLLPSSISSFLFPRFSCCPASRFFLLQAFFLFFPSPLLLVIASLTRSPLIFLIIY